jgi:hypothetical protein
MTHTYSISICAALFVGFGAIPAQAALSVQVNPRSTYLLTNNDPLAINSTAISLADSGIAPGDLIRLERFGSYDVGAPPPFFGDVLDGFSAVFSSSSILLGSSLLNRVPGAIDAGDDILTRPTSFGSINTDIAEDFGLTNDSTLQFIEVLVPQGASHIFLSARDTFFSDNTDLNDDFRLDISVVPEASSAMLGMVAIAVGMCRRLRSPCRTIKNVGQDAPSNGG